MIYPRNSMVDTEFGPVQFGDGFCVSKIGQKYSRRHFWITVAKNNF